MDRTNWGFLGNERAFVRGRRAPVHCVEQERIRFDRGASAKASLAGEETAALWQSFLFPLHRDAI